MQTADDTAGAPRSSTQVFAVNRTASESDDVGASLAEVLGMKNAGLLCAVLLSACGGPLKYQVPSTSRAPGADARVIADVASDQGQTHLEIDVTNLPPPARVVPTATTYLVWYRKDSSSTWARIGGLKYEEGDREGKLSGSVPEVAFDLIVVAEASESPASPSPDVVVAQRIQD